MRLQERRLTESLLRVAVDMLEIIEEYPRDKYLPSFLLGGEVPGVSCHAVVATDLDNIRVVTMYVPDSQQWDDDGRFRRARE